MSATAFLTYDGYQVPMSILGKAIALLDSAGVARGWLDELWPRLLPPVAAVSPWFRRWSTGGVLGCCCSLKLR